MILEAEYLGLYTDSLFSLFIFSFPGRIKSKKQNPEVRVSMSSLKSWNSVWMEGSRSNTWPIVELTAVKAWAELLTSSSSSVGGAMIPAWFGYCLHFQPHLSLLFFTQVTAQMQVTLTAACCYLCSLSCLYTLLLFSHWVLSDSLRAHELQDTRLPCPSLSPGVCSNPCPLSWWSYLTIHLILCHPFLILPSVFPSIFIF